MYIARQKQTDIENKLVVTSEEREGEGAHEGYGIKRYKLLLCIK